MKTNLTLILLAGLILSAQAQFPYSPGKSGNGSFAKYSGRAINYDFGSSRVGVLHTKQTELQSTNGTYGFPDLRTWSVNLGAAVNQSTFTLFEKGFKPGLDGSIDFARTWESTRNDTTAENHSKQFFFRGVIQTKELKFLDTTTAYKKVERTNVDFGLNIGFSQLNEEPLKANARSYFSVGAYVGFSSNQKGALKEKELNEVISTSGNQQIVDSEKRYIGKPSNGSITKVFIDYGRRLAAFNDEKYPNTDVNEKALYFLARLHPEATDFETLDWNAIIGLSINQYSNIVLGGIFFEFTDFTENSLPDALAVKLYVGVPLKLNK